MQLVWVVGLVLVMMLVIQRRLLLGVIYALMRIKQISTLLILVQMLLLTLVVGLIHLIHRSSVRDKRNLARYVSSDRFSLRRCL